MISYAEQLRQVRDSLTPENWNKGSYFQKKSNIFCMCVHGAAQALVNPEVKKALRNKDINSAAARAVGVGDVGADADKIKNNSNLLEVWKARPDYVKEDYLDYGNTSLHYLMGMLGITVGFNDDYTTTLEDLKDKLSEAAKWSEENEEFLNSN